MSTAAAALPDSVPGHLSAAKPSLGSYRRKEAIGQGDPAPWDLMLMFKDTMSISRVGVHTRSHRDGWSSRAGVAWAEEDGVVGGPVSSQQVGHGQGLGGHLREPLLRPTRSKTEAPLRGPSGSATAVRAHRSQRGSPGKNVLPTLTQSGVCRHQMTLSPGNGGWEGGDQEGLPSLSPPDATPSPGAGEGAGRIKASHRFLQALSHGGWGALGQLLHFPGGLSCLQAMWHEAAAVA